MNNRLLLVDGHNLLFRMFFGMPDNFYTYSGVKFNAVYGFGSVMSKVISMIRPSHAIVVFDSADCGERRQLDAAYKANRPDYSEMAPNDCPFSQLGAIYALLNEMKIPNSEIHGCEADDVIASYAVNFSDKIEVVILSTDRDYWQLISDSVTILNYHGADSSFVTPDVVRNKFGVSPEQFADFKCLIGDKSDNIIGVPGVGSKRAAELLGQFGTIDGIYEHIDEIKSPATKKAILESRDRLELNSKLIRLCGCASMPMELDELKFEYKSPGDIMWRARYLADLHANYGK